MRSRKSWSRFGLSVATLASALPAAARAQDPTFGAGLFVGYNVQRQSVEWGAEAFATLRWASGSSDAGRVGLGPLIQFGLLGTADPRITFALHGGSELKREVLALTGELGITYRAGVRGGVGVHVGMVPEVSLVNLAVRYQFLLDEAWFGVGARLMPTYGAPEYLREPEMPTWVSGRALRSDAGRVSCPAALQLAWDTLAWALIQAPDEVRAALHSVSEYAPSRALEADAPSGLERYGRLSAPELDRIAQRAAAQSGERLTGLLSA